MGCTNPTGGYSRTLAPGTFRWVNVSRRQLLQWFGALGFASCTPSMTVPPPPFRFLTKDEVALWDALADFVWPGTPGGAALGASRYLDSLLSAFESAAPLFFADAEGKEPLPLDPVMEQSFRLQLYGSDVVAYPNAAVLGPIVGLRSQVRDGLAAAATSLGGDFASKPFAERFEAWKQLPSAFRELVLDLVCQGLWSIPAYGGNVDEHGWAAIHVQGRGQPTGYSLWDETLGEYRERPEAPMTTIDPGDDPEAMTPDTRALLDTVTRSLGGRVTR